MRLFPGLVLPAAAGDPRALHQHLAGHHVLQAAHVAAASGAIAPGTLHALLYNYFVNICTTSQPTNSQTLTLICNQLYL